MIADTFARRGVVPRLPLLPDIPPRIIALTSITSGAAVIGSSFIGMPIWVVAIAGLVPWVPALSVETVWTARNYGWLALFYVLAITQTGHLLEHVAQMVQIHVLNRTGPDARGIFGALDIEWVHVIWNTWVLIAGALLLRRFSSNRWLWATVLFAVWHEIEHLYIMSVYLDTGVEGTPGLLSEGGRIGGGLGLTRPDLHFFYNLIETTPLLIAFAVQVRRAYRGRCSAQS